MTAVTVESGQFFPDESIKSSSSTFYTPNSSAGSASLFFCRICHLSDGVLIRPCKCSGTIANVHNQCLETWAKLSRCEHCQVCKTGYARSRPHLKQFKEWKRPSYSVISAVCLLLLLLGYHGWALQLACFRTTVSPLHLTVYITMVVIDVLVLIAMVLGYLHGQSIQTYTNRAKSKRSTTSEEPEADRV